jgi:hypothetical protein
VIKTIKCIRPNHFMFSGRETATCAACNPLTEIGCTSSQHGHRPERYGGAVDFAERAICLELSA